jgi:hypothetical protein
MPRSYEPIKSTRVDAEQFTGWEGAESIMRWLPGIFYVPQGFEHSLRTPQERNQDGRPSKNAPEYLVFPNPSGPDIRIDVGTWLVVDSEKKTYMYSDSDFANRYRTVDDFDKVMQGLKKG